MTLLHCRLRLVPSEVQCIGWTEGNCSDVPPGRSNILWRVDDNVAGLPDMLGI
jgi:hypothetical protein